MYTKMAAVIRIALVFVLTAGALLSLMPDMRQEGSGSGSYASVASAPRTGTQSFTGVVHAQKAAGSTSTTETVNIKQKAADASKAEEARTLPQKTVYLTFDDGPSGLTPEVLDILEELDIRATFFVLGQQAKRFPEVVNRIYEEGHAIGNHSYNHNYAELYKNFISYWSQLKQTEEAVRLITGERMQLVRAPGGTAGKFDDVYFKLLEQAGYKIFDWNVDSGDSKRKGVPAEDIIREATRLPSGNEAVVLLHDGAGHEETVKALPEIIDFYKKHGYRFDILTPETKPVQFKVQKGMPDKPAPGSRWVADHIVPNTALFSTGTKLEVDMGGLAAEFSPGEYRMDEGRIMVPLRMAVERLGGSIFWKQESRSADVSLGGKRWVAVLSEGALVGSPGSVNRVISEAEMVGNVIWVPIRDVLELSGHPVTRSEWTKNAYKIGSL